MPMRRHSGGAGGVSPPPAPRSDELASLNDLLAGLADLEANGLRLQWRNHLGGIPPAHLPRWLLLRVLAYQIQAAALGDIDKATLRVIRQPKGQTPDSPESTSPTKRSSDFIAHLEQLDRLFAPQPGRQAKPVVLVEDNGPIHTSKRSLAALAARAHWLTVEWLPKSKGGGFTFSEPSQ